MALVKQEDGNDITDYSEIDAWLFKGSNHEIEVKSEDVKPTIKTKTKTLFTIETHNKLSEKAHKTRKEIKCQEDQWKEAIENAPVSDLVKNLCIYQCPKCNGVFKSARNFYKHLSITKHKAGLCGKINQFLFKTVAHICGICEKRILCDKRYILQHIKNPHKIGCLQTYCIRTGKKYSNKKSIITAKIGDKCTFSCLKCEYNCDSWRILREHIRDKNHGPLSRLKDYVNTLDFSQMLHLQRIGVL